MLVSDCITSDQDLPCPEHRASARGFAGAGEPAAEQLSRSDTFLIRKNIGCEGPGVLSFSGHSCAMDHRLWDKVCAAVP